MIWKTLAIIALSLVVLITAFCCLWLSICAAGGGISGAGAQTTYVLWDLLDIGVMVGALVLIGRLNKKKSAQR